MASVQRKDAAMTKEERGGVQAPAAWLSNLKAALAAGAKSFSIPPGTHRLSENLELSGLEGFTLEGDGATLVFAPGGGKLKLIGCRNCSIKGLALDMDPMPFAQGTVVDVDPASKSARVRLDAGYLSANPKAPGKNLRCVFFEPSGTRELPIIDTSTPPLVEVSPGLWRISSPRIFDLEGRTLSPGDRVAMSLHTGGGGLLLKDCAGIRMEDVSIWAAGGFAVTEDGFAEGGHRYVRCRITRRPGSDRLMAGAADGLHSITQKKGPQISGCEISHCFDDLVNIHGFISLALERRGDAFLIAGPGGQDFTRGSLLKFFRAPNAVPLGEAKIVECRRDASFPQAEVEKRVADHFKNAYNGFRLRSFFNAQVCEVALDRAPPIEPFDFVSCPDFGGAGAVIEDSHFHDGHIRGILLKSSGSRVERCRFERLARSGLVVAPEIYWLEGPFPRGLRIAGNAFTDCGFGALGKIEKHWEFAPLQVVSAFTSRLYPPLFSDAVNIQDIVVAGNTVLRAPGPGILLMNASNLVVDGNTIREPGAARAMAAMLDLNRNLPAAAEPSEAEKAALRDPSYGILFIAVRGARGASNRVDGGRGLVGKGWNAEDVDVR